MTQLKQAAIALAWVLFCISLASICIAAVEASRGWVDSGAAAAVAPAKKARFL